MKPPRTGRARTFVAFGALAACGVALTTAALSDSASVEIDLDGSQNRFDIVVSGIYADSTGSWVPSEADWRQGNPDAYEIPLLAGDDPLLSPGARLDGRVAVKNASPKLSGGLELTILDPLPRGDETDPVTGNRVELFDQLIFTVKDGATTLFDRVPADLLTSYAWDEPFAAGAVKILDVSIEMSTEADNRWQLATTDVQFHFEAVTL